MINFLKYPSIYSPTIIICISQRRKNKIDIVRQKKKKKKICISQLLQLMLSKKGSLGTHKKFKHPKTKESTIYSSILYDE